MKDLFKLTIGIVVVSGMLLAIPIFAWIVATILALVVLRFLFTEYKEVEEKLKDKDPE